MKDERQCTATGKASGQRCRRSAIIGGRVCIKHGGSAPQVKAAANRRYAETLANLIDPDRALREAATLAYSDITKLLDGDGHILPVRDWPQEMRGAVSGYETEVARGNIDKGDGQYDPILKTKLKLWDKPRNVELLFKHLGLLIERLNIKGDMVFTWEK